MGQKTTIRSISERSGVSWRVVAEILSERRTGKIRFGLDTEQKVLSVAKELKYRRNRQARFLRRGKKGAIGLLFQSVFDVFAPTLWKILDEAKRNDMLVVAENAVPGESMKCLEEDTVDGLIFFGVSDKRILDSVNASSLPKLFVNCNLRSGGGCISFDEEGASSQAVRILASKGRRKILYIAPIGGDHYSVEARYSGICSALKSAGMPQPGRIGMDAHAPLSILLENKEAILECDSALLFSDNMGPKLYSAMRELGRKIPEDFSVISFNDMDYSNSVHPRLSTFSPDYIQLGIDSFRMLDQMMNGIKCPEMLYKYNYLERESA